MNNQAIVLKVFVASPNDVLQDARSVQEVATNLNSTFGNRFGLCFQVVRWETDAYPGISTDGQAVINEEIPNDWDIFIGILWTRFGTPTGRAESGTQEEFQRAYQRYLGDPNQIRIMCYFNEIPKKINEIDANQLAQVNEFRKQIRAHGALDWSYYGAEDFRFHIVFHLLNQILDWGKTWGDIKRVPIRVPTTSLGSEIQETKEGLQADNDLGYFEVEKDILVDFSAVFFSTRRMVAALNALRSDIDRKSVV
jgi:hypothetical protein